MRRGTEENEEWLELSQKIWGKSEESHFRWEHAKGEKILLKSDNVEAGLWGRAFELLRQGARKRVKKRQ